MIRPLVSKAFIAVTAFVVAASAIGLPARHDSNGPHIVLTKATSTLVHSNSRDGSAILSAGNLKPGDVRHGEVTIVNKGDAGDMYLVGTVPSRERALADRLTLKVADGSRVLVEGPLSGADGCVALGSVAGGESRSYRFTVAFAPGGPGDNAYAGSVTRVDYEWVQSNDVSGRCTMRSDLAEPDVGNAHSVSVGDMAVAIEPGPYRFSRRTGKAAVRVRCLRSPTGVCRGRIELERRRGGEGRGIAMAVGGFSVRAGKRTTVRLTLNARARKRVTTTGTVPVRAYVTAKDTRGRKHRAAYRDRLTYGTAKKRRRR
jgi:hypothetical protein